MTRTIYVIYEIDGKGMLEEPQSEYGRRFDYYDTEDEAIEAIGDSNSHQEYVILKRVNKQINWEEK